MNHPLSCNRYAARAAGCLLALAVFALDQWSKSFVLALAHESGYGVFPLEITSFFNLVLVANTGVSFGLLARLPAYAPLLLTLVTGAIALALFVWLLCTRDRFALLALPFILGGALGNIVDRMRFGAVTDFLDFHMDGYHWPAFNIADSAIFIGVVILALISIVVREPTKP